MASKYNFQRIHALCTYHHDLVMAIESIQYELFDYDNTNSDFGKLTEFSNFIDNLFGAKIGRADSQ